ncbi:hypothetical protein AURDEDRAFT_120317 [Auricularia subglabra TFB-10046 SS5]|nr:hypothetical protein AURDEDRAFT_120317 [Auricularia subglabra TFB-10046 SS5]
MAHTSIDALLADAAKSPNCLLGKKFAFENFRVRLVDWEANGRKGKASDKAKGIVYQIDSNKEASLAIYGVVDADKSKIGDYGSLWMPGNVKNWAPDLGELAKAKFLVYITYPYKDKVSMDVWKATSDQMLRLNKLQGELNKVVAEEQGVIAVTDDNTTDWVEFEKGSEGITASVKTSLGDVYATATVKVKGSDITGVCFAGGERSPNSPLELSPSKRKVDASTKPRCDVHDFFDPGRVPKSNTLEPIQSLPVFLADGAQAEARDSQDLGGLLYGGRWVKAEVRMVVWNIKGAKKNTRTYKLEIIKLCMLPSFKVTNPSIKFLKPGSLNEVEGEVEQDLLDAGTKDKKTEGGNEDDEDDDTVSESNKAKGIDKKRKRGDSVDDARSPKAVRTETE